MTIGLFSLPTETIVLILTQVCFVDVVHCLQTCHRLNSIAKDSGVYEYKSELALANLEDGPVACPGIRGRIEQLKNHQIAWNNFERTSVTKYSVDTRSRCKVFGGVLGFEDANVFRLVHIPSALRGIERREWHFVGNRFGCLENFSFDPSQDLLVQFHVPEENADNILSSGIDWEIDILSLQNGECHPLTSVCNKIKFQAQLAKPIAFYDSDFQICKDFIGVAFADSSEKGDSGFLKIWDWKSGQLVFDECAITSFAFLTDRFALTSGFVATGDGLLSIMDLATGHTLGLSLPHVSSPYSLDRLFIVSSTSPATRNQDGPFQTSSRDRLFVANLEITGPYDSNMSFALFIPLSALLRLAEENDMSLNHVLSWEAWGPKDSKLMPVEFHHTLACHTFGLRTVLIKSTSSYSTQFCLYDFNPLSLRESTTRTATKELVDYSYEAIAEETFQNPIRTSLPCRIFEGELSGVGLGYSLMLSEDALIFRSASEKEDEIIVYSF